MAHREPDQQTQPTRFASALSRSCLKPLYDEILFETDDCAVIPTLGSIVPNWLLVVPRAHVLNFATWKRGREVGPHQIVANVARRFGLNDKQVMWFEHGASAFGSPVGCGVEHAHLHVLVDAPFRFDDLVKEAASLTGDAWHETSSLNSYQHLVGDCSYLVLASSECAVLSKPADGAGSQFFRRAIASIVGEPDKWNYRHHAHLGNVRKTIERFGSRSVAVNVRSSA